MTNPFYHEPVEETLPTDEVAGRRERAADQVRELDKLGLKDEAKKLANELKNRRQSEVTVSEDE